MAHEKQGVTESTETDARIIYITPYQTYFYYILIHYTSVYCQINPVLALRYHIKGLRVFDKLDPMQGHMMVMTWS